MPAHVVLTVKFFYVDKLGGDGTHLQKVQRAALDGPFDVFFLTEGAANPLPGFIQLPDLGLGEQVVPGRPVAFAGKGVLTGAYLPGNQVFSLPQHRFYKDGVTGTRCGRKEHARLFAVHHGLHHHVHGTFPQLEMLGVILHPLGLQRRHALPDALHELPAFHKQKCIVLAGIGGVDAVFVGGR